MEYYYLILKWLYRGHSEGKTKRMHVYLLQKAPLREGMATFHTKERYLIISHASRQGYHSSDICEMSFVVKAPLHYCQR
jgi:hypothetical protein